MPDPAPLAGAPAPLGPSGLMGRADPSGFGRLAPGQPHVLHVLHGGGGGLEVAVDLLAEQTAGSFEHGMLWVESGHWTLRPPSGSVRRLIFRDPWALSRLVRSLGVDLVHVHHVLGDRRRLLRALKRLPVPYAITVHDFYLACPRIHMVPPGDVYCDAPTDPARCRDCLRRTPGLDVSIDAWRNEHGLLLRQAAFVTTPTAHTARVLQHYWPDLQVRVVSHLYQPPGPGAASAVPEDASTVEIGVVGALGPEKGGEMVERLAEAARARDLPLRFVVMGDTHRHGGPQSLVDGWLFVHGSYRREKLPQLLEQYCIRLAAFPAIWPETFCLTLSEVWASHVPALVPEFGALAERVKATGGGWTVPDWAQPDAWLDAIVRHVGDPEALAAAGERGWRSLSPPPAEHPMAALYADAMARPGTR